jgi:hypothetical protein
MMFASHRDIIHLIRFVGRAVQVKLGFNATNMNSSLLAARRHLLAVDPKRLQSECVSLVASDLRMSEPQVFLPVRGIQQVGDAINISFGLHPPGDERAFSKSALDAITQTFVGKSLPTVQEVLGTYEVFFVKTPQQKIDEATSGGDDGVKAYEIVIWVFGMGLTVTAIGLMGFYWKTHASRSLGSWFDGAQKHAVHAQDSETRDALVHPASNTSQQALAYKRNDALVHLDAI